jgi:hypothetical protein
MAYKNVDALLLEKLIPSELEGALQEVPSTGWAKPGRKSAETFLLDDLFEATNQAAVIGDGVKLDTGFYTSI